jgi:hypothetical protein
VEFFLMFSQPVGRRLRLFVVAAILCSASLTHCSAFSLLGPFADWMSPSNALRLPGDIGGPMNIGEGYRWNVPVVTYGFDQSFVVYFGSNGIAAVESAFQMLNDLPAASDILLTNYPLYTLRFNYTATSEQLMDLKTAALRLVMEHLGLAPPTRNIFDLRRYDPAFYSNPDAPSWPPGTIPDLILERNFDPETFEPIDVVDGTSNTWFVGYAQLMPNTGDYWEAIEFRIDPLDWALPAVMDTGPNVSPFPGSYDTLGNLDMDGGFYTSLTRDDIGGLRYLLSSNDINPEILLPDVHGTGSNAVVNLALRPGVEKITFTRQTYDSLLGQFVPMTNRYTDTYITNGTVMHQDLERVTTQPDFIFSVADLQTVTPGQRGWNRTGTSNWWNSAKAVGGTNAGPGIIFPPARVTFDTRGAHLSTQNGGTYDYTHYRWGSFDDLTNPPVAYPQAGWASDSKPMTVHLHLAGANGLNARFELHAPVPVGGQAVLQTSTDLVHWTSVNNVDAIVNDGEATTWDNWCSATQMFFRLLPQ